MKWLYFGNRILCSPLEALFTLLIFILSQELEATPLQLTLIAMTKPAVSLLAFCFTGKGARKSLIALNLLGCLPCLLFPFMQSAWFFVIAYFCFWLALRASYPVWTELLKRAFPLEQIGFVTARGASINFAIILILPWLLSFWMGEIWKLLFFGCALLQLLNTLLLMRIESITLKGAVFPWKEALTLCRKEGDFTKYLALFFLGGAGLVALQPLLPELFKAYSYTEVAAAIGFCKGIAFVTSSPLWARLTNRISLYALNFYINIFSCLFLLLLGHSIFAAYFIYGIMQAGCELSLNLSPPVFSKEKESTLYASVNLLFIGIRGCLFPVIGELLFISTNIYTVLWAAGALCFLAVVYAKYLDNGRVVYDRTV